MPPAGHALWAEVGGCITFVITQWDRIIAAGPLYPVTLDDQFGFHWGLMDVKPYMPASAGQPSLHGNEACMVYWTKGVLRRNRRERYARFFCLVVIPGYGFGV